MTNTVTVKELVDSSGYVVLSGEEFLEIKSQPAKSPDPASS